MCGNSIYTKPKEIRRLVGYMPDFFGVYDDMTVIEYLEFFAAAYRILPTLDVGARFSAGNAKSKQTVMVWGGMASVSTVKIRMASA